MLASSPVRPVTSPVHRARLVPASQPRVDGTGSGCVAEFSEAEVHIVRVRLQPAAPHVVRAVVAAREPGPARVRSPQRSRTGGWQERANIESVDRWESVPSPSEQCDGAAERGSTPDSVEARHPSAFRSPSRAASGPGLGGVPHGQGTASAAALRRSSSAQVLEQQAAMRALQLRQRLAQQRSSRTFGSSVPRFPGGEMYRHSSFSPDSEPQYDGAWQVSWGTGGMCFRRAERSVGCARIDVGSSPGGDSPGPGRYSPEARAKTMSPLPRARSCQPFPLRLCVPPHPLSREVLSGVLPIAECWQPSPHTRPPHATEPTVPLAFWSSRPRFRRTDVFTDSSTLRTVHHAPPVTPGPGYYRAHAASPGAPPARHSSLA